MPFGVVSVVGRGISLLDGGTRVPRGRVVFSWGGGWRRGFSKLLWDFLLDKRSVTHNLT